MYPIIGTSIMGKESSSMMKKIRVVAVPDGEVPEWVREQWVGVELFAEPVYNPQGFGLISESPVSAIKGYEVALRSALAAQNAKACQEREEGKIDAAKKRKKASRWWYDWWRDFKREHSFPEGQTLGLVFPAEVCEVIG